MNTARQSSFVAILGALVGFGIYLFIGTKGLYGLFGIGSLVLYCGAFMQIIAGIMKMAVTFGKTAEMVPLVNYYFEIVNTNDEMTYGEKKLDLSAGFELEFKNVSFKYPSAENYALRNVNLKIENGEHLAVVGRNGSGKTTFIKLMCRLYDVTDGEILINGTDIKEYTRESITGLYSVVFRILKYFPYHLRIIFAQAPISTATDFMLASKMQILRTEPNAWRIRKTHIFIRIWTKQALKYRVVRRKSLLLRGHCIRTLPLLFWTSPRRHSTPLRKTRYTAVSIPSFKIKRRFIFLTGFQAAPSAIKSPCLTTRGLSSTERIASFWVQAANTASFGMRRQGIISHKGLGE